MSYTVLARKYRPLDFEEIIGQEHITTTLKNALANNHIAHAYLFTGPRGTGKTSTARILAKAINCEKGPTPHPCGKCKPCLEITEGRFLDCMEIDGASNRSINDIRDLREKIKFAPIAGKFKVYIIDEVHQITPEAFNALLKTLEEPPAFVKFIFATTAPEKVPATILSRCQRFDFRLLSIKKIVEKLKQIAAQEKIKIDEEAILAIATMAEGSMRDAETILDQARAFSNSDIQYRTLVESMGLIEKKVLIDIFESLRRRDIPKALTLINDVLARGRDILQLVTALLAHARNLIVAKYSDVRENLIPYSAETIQALVRQADEFALDELLYIFAVLQQTHETTRRFSDSKYPLEVAVVKLACAADKVEIKEMIEAVKKIQSGPAGALPLDAIARKAKEEAPRKSELGTSAAAHHHGHKASSTDTLQAALPEHAAQEPLKSPAKSSAHQEAPHVDVEVLENTAKDHGIYDEDHLISQAIQTNWEAIIRNIQQRRMSLATLLVQATVMGVKNKTLTIGFSKKAHFSKEIIEHSASKKIVEEELSKMIERAVRLNIVMCPEEHAARAGAEAPLETPEGEDAPDTIEPLIKNALDMFNGRLM